MTAKFCRNCGNKIQVMAYQGQDYCSENCGDELKKKDEANEIAQAAAGIITKEEFEERYDIKGLTNADQGE